MERDRTEKTQISQRLKLVEWEKAELSEKLSALKQNSASFRVESEKTVMKLQDEISTQKQQHQKEKEAAMRENMALEHKIKELTSQIATLKVSPKK